MQEILCESSAKVLRIFLRTTQSDKKIAVEATVKGTAEPSFNCSQGLQAAQSAACKPWLQLSPADAGVPRHRKTT